MPIPLFTIALGLISWAYWPTLEFLYSKWSTDPQYSHGFLVPLFSGYLFWRAFRDELNCSWSFGACSQTRTLNSSSHAITASVVAIGLLAVSIGMRVVAGGMLFHQLDVAAMFLSLTAALLLILGWRGVIKSLPALGFLMFMVPLPYEVERNVGGPLRIIATQASTYLLQTLGQPAIAEGNTILIESHTLEVADACSGLKMLMTFAAFAVGAVLLSRQSWIEKLLILLGIVPIAVTTNVLRIAATGVSYAYAGDNKQTMNFLHDVYGWLMMPLGLAFLGLQMWCLQRMFIREERI